MKFFKHLWLVTKHRYRVFKYCLKCGIPLRGFFHDLSKFCISEFFPSVKYYKGNGSPIDNERKDNNLYSDIVNHHTGRNKHHWEYWVNYYKGDFLLKALPYKICIEFICDMIAASQTYNEKDYQPQMVNEYWTKRKDRLYIHSITKQYISYLFAEYEKNNFAGLKKKKTKLKYQEMFNGIAEIERYQVNIVRRSLVDEYNK